MQLNRPTSMGEELLSKIIKAREAADSIEPGVERSGTPGSRSKASEPAKRAPLLRIYFEPDEAIYLMIRLSPAPRARLLNLTRSWGSASLHPRLYADVRSAHLFVRRENAEWGDSPSK